MENINEQATNESPKKINWDEKYGKGKSGKKSKKGLFIGLGVAVAVIGLGAYGVHKITSKVQEVQDSIFGAGTVVEAFGEKDMSTYIDVTGTVESQDVENVYTTLQYPVEEIKVKVGDHVKKGDVICIIDDTDIETKISDLEAQASDEDRVAAKQIESASHSLSNTSSANSRTLDSANQSISEAKKAFEDADSDYYEKLSTYNQKKAEAAKTATSTDAIENDPEVKAAKTALDTANDTWYVKQYAYYQATDSYSDTVASTSESYTTAKDTADLTIINNTSSYSATASQLASYYDMKNKTVITAPIDGVVTAIQAVEGIAPSGQIMTIQDDKNFELNVDIKEKDIFTIKEGMNVEFAHNTLTNVTGDGEVTSVNNFATANVSTAQSSAQGAAATVDNTFSAKLTVSNYTDMLLGMKVKARISTGEEMKTNAVAYTAISSSAEGDYVYVAEEAGNGMYMVTKKMVDKGMSGDYYTQITGGELEEGDLVISYPSTVTEGGVISIDEKTSDSKDGSVVEDKDSETEDDTEEE